MKRIVVTGVFLAAGWAEAADRLLNPYADTAWDRVEYVHSFSHQHGQDPHVFWNMGYRHLPLSNDYPSKPVYPLPDAFLQKHPEATGAPSAEHHSTTDSGDLSRTLTDPEGQEPVGIADLIFSQPILSRN